MFIVFDIMVAYRDIINKYLTPIEFPGAQKEVYCGLYFAFKLVDLYSLVVFLRYWCDDSSETRKLLPNACCAILFGDVLVASLSLACLFIPWISVDTAVHTIGS